MDSLNYLGSLGQWWTGRLWWKTVSVWLITAFTHQSHRIKREKRKKKLCGFKEIYLPKMQTGS